MRPTVLYSGGCRFCKWVARHLLTKLDKFDQLDIIPFRHQMAQEIFARAGIPEAERYKTWWYWSGTHLWPGNKGAITTLLLSLHHTFELGHWLDAHPRVERQLDRLDGWVKRHRPRFSKWVKDGPAIRRVNGRIYWHD